MMKNIVIIVLISYCFFISCKDNEEKKVITKDVESALISSLQNNSVKANTSEIFIGETFLSDDEIVKSNFNKRQYSKNQPTKWKGKYSCNFLRMKEESADRRAYAMIYINIENDAATFQLESYLEDLNKELSILSCSSTEIILVEKNNKNSKFIITKNNRNFELKSDLLNKTIGEISTYELVKK